MSFQAFFQAPWFTFLEEEATILVTESVELVERELRMNSSFHDYSFVVFPMAKAYESFLKKFLYSIGLIDKERYGHRQFRIGSSLNPDIPPRHRDEYWLYDNVSASCGEELARELWDAWLTCRNHLFHYFPEVKSNITLEEAQRLLFLMDSAMRSAYACSLKKRSGTM